MKIFHLKISDSASFHFLCSCSYFVHVHPVYAVFGVLSTYSLKINSLLCSTHPVDADFAGAGRRNRGRTTERRRRAGTPGRTVVELFYTAMLCSWHRYTELTSCFRAIELGLLTARLKSSELLLPSTYYY